MSFRLYPPVWFLTLGCLQWVLVRNFPSPLDLPDPVRWAGLAGIGIGGLLFSAAVASFRRHRTTILPFEDATDRLIKAGIFRYSRNPIYLGEAVILAGIALKTGQLWPWVVVPVFVLGINRSVIAWEEAILRKRFGEEFDRYCRQTGRWW